ncbi:hypothetical protein [uncultured Shewanella sp.]|uniref:hypothetical protein n=1 Tax=Shewanella atlantica TaxID=271099 RepID=UPI002605E004|nr:hypothetical protein [uncultured Shewanella sp.]
MNNEKQYFFDQPKNVKRILYLLYACCALLVALEFVIHRHVYHSWENLIGFYPIYGFVGCVILVLIARWMRTFLMRSEDYYDRNDDNDHDNHSEDAPGQHTRGGGADGTANKNIGDHNVDA